MLNHFIVVPLLKLLLILYSNSVETRLTDFNLYLILTPNVMKKHNKQTFTYIVLLLKKIACSIRINYFLTTLILGLLYHLHASMLLE